MNREEIKGFMTYSTVLRYCLQDARDALRALQDTLQKDVFSKLETVLESFREAQKD